MIIAGSTEGELFCCSISTENYFGGSLNHSVSLLYSIPGKDSLTGPDSYFSLVSENSEKIANSNNLINHIILIRAQGLISCVLSSKDSSKPKRVVLASTKNRLLHFIGPDSKESIERVFSGYSSGGNVIEFPSTAIFNSKLILSPVMVENEARVFAWSCMSGLEGRLKIFFN